MSEKEPPAFYRIPLDMDAEMKRIERKELINAAKMLKENCKTRDGKCEGCPFLDGWDYCKLTQDMNCFNPSEWDLPEVQDDE